MCGSDLHQYRRPRGQGQATATVDQAGEACELVEKPVDGKGVHDVTLVIPGRAKRTNPESGSCRERLGFALTGAAE
jgi:hypothetical protein